MRGRNNLGDDAPLARVLGFTHKAALILIAVSTAMLLALVIKDQFFEIDIWSKPSVRRHISPIIRQAWPSSGAPV